MKIRLKSAACLVLSSLAGLASFSVSADKFSPANFDFSGQELVEKMATISSGSHVLYCRSDISAQGKASMSHCFGKTLSFTTLSTAERTLDQLQFTPAKVEGKNIPVRMSYRVSLVEKDGSTSAYLLPNLGTMSAKYGNNYSAPQERLDVNDWYASYSEKSSEKAKPFFGMGDNARIAAEVDIRGNTSATDLIKTERSTRRDSKLALNALKKAQFIPGMVKGKEVKMDYVVGLNHNDVNHSLASN